VDRLVVPLAVIDISECAQDNPDARVTPDDIAAYEAQHGPLPDGVCVAMFSGWERHLGKPKYRNAGDGGVMRFPGFHIEAAAMLLERDISGIAVDTLSLDYGASPDFPVHHAWLGGGRWGIESVANLSTLPPVGATLVVGAPKIEGASGGPSRVIALV
ncbi:MAG: cyclase family protein, partial [Chitinophagales bacterium]|nr:cyclase family protein [Hyphomicrobiales bacterium]